MSHIVNYGYGRLQCIKNVALHMVKPARKSTRQNIKIRFFRNNDPALRCLPFRPSWHQLPEPPSYQRHPLPSSCDGMKPCNTAIKERTLSVQIHPNRPIQTNASDAYACTIRCGPFPPTESPLSPLQGLPQTTVALHRLLYSWHSS